MGPRGRRGVKLSLDNGTDMVLGSNCGRGARGGHSVRDWAVGSYRRLSELMIDSLTFRDGGMQSDLLTKFRNLSPDGPSLSVGASLLLSPAFVVWYCRLIWLPEPGSILATAIRSSLGSA